MPRTTIVLQTKHEPTSGQFGALLENMLDKANGLGMEPLKAHGIAPKANGNSLVLTVTRHTRNSVSTGSSA